MTRKIVPVNPMTLEEVDAWEQLLHEMEIEEIAQLSRICEEYCAKFHGFDRRLEPKRTPEWLAKAAKRLEGQTDPCCECGEEYPTADLLLYRNIFCPKCRSEP